ncbi:MAG: response regulator, partial [Candidatus Gastranaerophilales bacterium]|nr:response regulator [Candidatus Gastranaerophilales bacterium]
MQFSYKILVLDDDKLVTSSIKSLFMIENFTDTVLYNNPQEALEYLKNNHRDVIISDFLMPEMNGIEFLAEAKKLHPNSSLILLTGYADKENAIKAINEVGLYKYIEKPWDNDQLIINIKNAYEHSQLTVKLEETNAKLIKYSRHLEELVKEKTQDIMNMNEHLSAVINNCADGILIFSSGGTVIDSNPACESLFGLSEEIIQGKYFKELFKIKNTEAENIFNQTEEKLLRDITIENFVNGQNIPVEISCACIPAKSETDDNKYVFVIRNVNFQKEMERLREDFIAALTHDLRTPSLAAIQTLEYFLNGKLGELTDKQRLLLSTMKKSNEDMLGLINTLLEVYKYEAGHLRLVKTSFNFETLADECINQIMPLANKKCQKVYKNFKNLENKLVIADRNEIRRVILNLLGNALKYTPENGDIEVKAEIEAKDLHFS